jgi:hypothetical protein
MALPWGLRRCPDCDLTVADTYTVCPFCKERERKRTEPRRKTVLWTLAAVLYSLFGTLLVWRMVATGDPLWHIAALVGFFLFVVFGSIHSAVQWYRRIGAAEPQPKA